MKKLPLLLVALSFLLLSCGRDPVPANEALASMRLSYETAIEVARQNLEIIGSDFRITRTNIDGNTIVCNRPVPRSIVQAYGQQRAKKMMLGVCLIDQKLAPATPPGRSPIEGSPQFDYDDELLAKYREGLIFPKAMLDAVGDVPTEPILPFERKDAEEALAINYSTFTANLDKIISQAEKDGVDSGLIDAFKKAKNSLLSSLSRYQKTKDGATFDKDSFDLAAGGFMYPIYESLFGEQPPTP
jgi:hypothetical protein